MASILNISSNALSVFQRALNTTSNNIVNAGSEGYTRQRVNMVARVSERSGNSFEAGGVEFAGLDRITDQFAILKYRAALSDTNQYSSFYDQAVIMDSLLSNDATDLSQNMNTFFESLQTLVDDPSSLPNRQTLLSEAELMSEAFQRMYNEMQNQSLQVDQAIRLKVDEINALSSSIADMNSQIIGSLRENPELLDQRDRLLADLAKLVGTTTIEQDDGSVTVTIGNGQTLVNNNTSTTLSTARNAFNPERLDIVVGVSVASSQITGGELGGLLGYREQVVDPTLNKLGRVAIAMADSFNEQHRMGIDSNGNLGGYFFKDVNDSTLLAQRAKSNTSNTGNEQLNVTISDVGALSDDNYRLDYDGANYTLRNLGTGTTSTFAGFPTSFEGFTLTSASGAPAAGDSYLITPTRYGMQDLDVSTMDIDGIAMGQPIRTSQAQSNIGTAELSQGEMVSRADYVATGQPDLPITINFTAANTYELRDGANVLIEGGIAYTPGQINDIFPTPGAYDPGFRITMTGSPEVGDTFTIAANTSADEDSRNGLALGQIFTDPLIGNNRFTLTSSYSEAVAFVGNEARQADINYASSNILKEQAQDRLSSVAEVNLEEEAANLLRFQQLFTAATQLIRTVSEVFNTLAAALA